jgi:hypothetical protein
MFSRQGAELVALASRLGFDGGRHPRRVVGRFKKRAGSEKAHVIENLMKERADHWTQEPYPFGSEMAWDSTGQEEVYAWCNYFGYDDKALVSLNSIIGYMPTLPHWGYNGNARRYWDFLYGGKIRRIERQLHHYGSGSTPFRCWRTIANIPTMNISCASVWRHDGRAVQHRSGRICFGGVHSFPSTLKWDLTAATTAEFLWPRLQYRHLRNQTS